MCDFRKYNIERKSIFSMNILYVLCAYGLRFFISGRNELENYRGATAKWQRLVCRTGQAGGNYAARRGRACPQDGRRGVITGVHAEIDPAKIGLPIGALIRISVMGDVLTRMNKTVREMPEVLECYRGTGTDSFTLKVAAESIEHLESLIDKLAPFGTTSTSIILSTLVRHGILTRRVVSTRKR